MVMKASTKVINCVFKKNISRLISITLIVFLGIAFVEGLGTLAFTIEHSFSNEMNERNVFDLNLKATSETGFASDSVDKFIDDLRSIDGVLDAQAYTVLERVEGASGISGIISTIVPENTRLVILPDDGFRINELKLVEGNMLDPSKNEAVVERSSEHIREVEVGSEIKLGSDSDIKIPPLTVSGIVGNPTIFTLSGEPTLTNQDNYLEQIIYVSSSFLDSIFPNESSFIPKTDVIVTFENTKGMNRFSDSYLSKVNEHKEKISNNNTLKSYTDYVCLTVEDTASYAILATYTDKVRVIALIFPLFFTLVTSLVVLTTMTRLIEEERSMIACQKSLGVSNGRIIWKYVFFSLVALIIGSAVGMAVGMYTMPAAIFPAFTICFFVPPMSAYVEFTYGIVSMIFMIIVTLLVTICVVRSDLKQQPAALMLPKAPRPGKKVFLEHIPFIWKRLAFRYKSSFRNIFRYKRHLIMTVVAISGSTALVFAGFALMAISQDKTTAHYETIGNTLLPVAFVIMIFAILLSIFVIYNLTDMNIQERQREIATLSVLGYRDYEISAYIFREIIIMTIFGIIIGIPLGCLLVWGVFEYVDFGKLSSVSWYYYLGTGLLVLLFVFIVDLLFLRKIKKIDMTSSLKSVD